MRRPASCRLDHEIERYDPTNGTLVAWIRVPSINDGTGHRHVLRRRRHHPADRGSEGGLGAGQPGDTGLTWVCGTWSRTA